MSLDVYPSAEKHRRLFYYLLALVFVLLVTAGIFARNGWFPSTDPMSGKRTGWFGQTVAKNAPSSWNPLPMFTPTPTPLPLSKEYVYAGSRLLAVEDANASAVPPADISVWRPGTGVWYVLGGPGSAQTIEQLGQSGDVPVQGDYDGDGKTDFAVWRPSTGVWFITPSSGNGSYYSYQFGQSGDIPLVGDFDGDGKTDYVVFRTSGAYGYWYVKLSSDGTSYYDTLQFGLSTDVPAPADIDGDGKSDLNVWRSSNNAFYTLYSSNGDNHNAAMGSGVTGTPVCGDYDGDGRANYAIFNAGSWSIMNTAENSVIPTTWGQADDVPVQNDYDGDGKVDLAVWRSASSGAPWIIRNSHDNSTRNEYWGQTADIPVPAYYRR